MMRGTTVLLPLALTLWATNGQQTTEAPGGGVERFKGVIDLPGLELELVVSFTPNAGAGGYTATIDIPLQGVAGAALADVTFNAEKIGFTFKPAGAPYEAVFAADRAKDGDTATGTLTQAGQTFAMRLERVSEEEAKAVGPKRPQTPKPPFPYQQREVSYRNESDGTTLAGTLTIPQGGGPHPAAVLISGSGPQDRDETLLGHKPFLVIADHLTRRGVAVLRVDDRGVGGSSGSVMDSTSEAFAGDAVAGIAFLRQQPEIDAKRIGLIGHSEGGVIAPIVAARSDDVAFIVLLAGTALPGADILKMQMRAILEAAGAPVEAVRRQLEAQAVVIERVLGGAEKDEVRQAVRELVALQMGQQSPAQADASEAIVEQQTANLLSPWFRWFLSYDPRQALRNVRCPALALIGSLDLQVPAERNLPEIEKALREAGNKDVTVKELEGLNHLFQKARTGVPAEYAMIAETFDEDALRLMTDWIRSRTGLDR